MILEHAIEHETVAALQRIDRYNLAPDVVEGFDFRPGDDVVRAGMNAGERHNIEAGRRLHLNLAFGEAREIVHRGGCDLVLAGHRVLHLRDGARGGGNGDREPLLGEEAAIERNPQRQIGRALEGHHVELGLRR